MIKKFINIAALYLLLSAGRPSENLSPKDCCKPSLWDEVLNIDTLKIGSIPAYTDTLTLLSGLGAPEKTSICGASGLYRPDKFPLTNPVYMWSYKGIDFLVNGDKVNLKLVRFTEAPSSLRLTYPSITLCHTTRLEDVKKVFPVSVKVSYNYFDPERKETFRLVRINPREAWTDEWILRFKGNKLYEVEFWTP
ncbi:hypothetical protein MYP_3766 [Sporocytophaga myxococcoides]|uniref:Uncharacterized protein n=1 Tax=Sporocytophaga myxococcoides TaxID=153721 RepID=A0A098LHS4_9BACT|nr:hypothetical protein [Sporocytophaga myxococcoides]GAL86536.1 hypothetical protein MYP_3766 [Sporocytophaga myxococcoides]